MQDRVPLYPGRVTLTPVSGQANTYDLTRADQPTQEGTPLNKASLLKDATAALFGKTNAAVPDDILSLLSKSVIAQGAKITDVLGNLISIPVDQIKGGVKIATGSYTGTGTYGESNPNSLTFDFVPRFFTVGSLEPISDGSGYVQSAGRGQIMLIINGGLALGYTISSNYCKLDGNTISWYAYDSDDNQFNLSGKKYGYIAIG